MEKTLLTKAEAVELHGSDECKTHFAKYKKFKSKSLEKALITTLKQHYKPVELVKQGRAFVFELGAKRTEIIDRKELLNYDNCGQGQIAYGYELHNLVLNFILDNCKNNLKNLSLNRWLIEIGLIDPRLGKASWSKNIRKGHLSLLMNQYNNERTKIFVESDIEMLEHFVNLEFKRIKRNIASVFEKLDSAGIIIHKKSMFGCPVDGDDEDDEDLHRELTQTEISEIAQLKRNLSTKYNVSIDEVSWKTNDDSVIAYNKEFKECLKVIGFKYVYQTHGCVVQASDKQIQKFIDKLNKKGQLKYEYGLSEEVVSIMLKDFKGIYGENSTNLAKVRQENLTGTTHIQQLKIIGEYVPMWEKLLSFYSLTSGAKASV